jgi:hypothetical protein
MGFRPFRGFGVEIEGNFGEGYNGSLVQGGVFCYIPEFGDVVRCEIIPVELEIGWGQLL